MKTFPKIETERLLLSELKAADIAQIVEYACNKNIAKYTTNLPFPYFEKDAIFWLNAAHQGLENGTELILAIRLKNPSQFIGGIGLIIEQKSKRAEIGYWIAEPFWQKGYATEATRAILEYGFEQLNLNKLTAAHLAKNPASGKVMEKCGMTKEAELKMHILKGSEHHDLIQYGLTKEAYEKNKAK